MKTILFYFSLIERHQVFEYVNVILRMFSYLSYWQTDIVMVLSASPNEMPLLLGLIEFGSL